jgi:hypothetical protein
MKHTKNDQEVSLDYVAANEKLVNGHCSIWMRTFLVGKNWSQKDRNRETKINHGLSVCPLKLYF